MTVVEALFLNPFEKWWRYGRFPWTFVAHLLLLGLTTSQVLIFLRRDVQHVSRTVRHFARLFVKSADSDGAPFGDKMGSMSQPSELQDSFARAIRHHFFINNVSIVNYHIVNTDVLKVWTTFRNGQVHTTSIDREDFTASIQAGSSQDYIRRTFPFLYDFAALPRVAKLEMVHNFHELGYPHGDDKAVCVYKWFLTTSFDGAESGEFYGRVKCRAFDCQGHAWRTDHFLHVFCAGLATVSLVLVGRKYIRCLRALRRLRASPDAWSKLYRGDVWALFSPWWALAIVMHVLQIWACYACMQPSPDTGVRFKWVGFSCFLTWLNVSQYFEYFPGYYMAFHTMGLGAGRVLRFLLSVTPLFYGFVLLSVCLFSESEMFESPTAATAVLFSLMNGDSIQMVFEEVYGIGGRVAQLFLYVFLFLFIYIVLNINITIISESYDAAKRHPQRDNLRNLREQLRIMHLPEEGLAPEPLLGGSAAGSYTGDSTPPERRAAAAVAGSTGEPTGRSLSGYMSPRFFQRKSSICDALAAAYPEDAYLQQLPTPPGSPWPGSRQGSKQTTPELQPSPAPNLAGSSISRRNSDLLPPSELPPQELAGGAVGSHKSHQRSSSPPASTSQGLPPRLPSPGASASRPPAITTLPRPHISCGPVGSVRGRSRSRDRGLSAPEGSSSAASTVAAAVAGELADRGDAAAEVDDLEMVTMPATWEWEDFDEGLRAVCLWAAHLGKARLPGTCQGAQREELSTHLQNLQEAVKALAELRPRVEWRQPLPPDI